MTRKRITGGLAGKILRIDLTHRRISTEETEKYAHRFISGRAINSHILLNEMSPETTWSDPENMIIFGVGCLVGTASPGACRVSVDTKHTYNNGKGSANFGGDFGAELKYAGFDHVVISGRAENPVYLYIHDGKAELRDAGPVWGRTTYETEETLRKELGDPRLEVASIGPAGENLVRGACIVSDCAKVGSGSGAGCVMGTKKLKALAVRGHGAINVAEPERFFKAVRTTYKKIKVSPAAGPFRKLGLIRLAFNPESEIWDINDDLIRNGQPEPTWPMEKRERLVGETTGVPKYEKRVTACFSCPSGHMPFLEIEDGKYAGTKGTGYWINSAYYSQRFDVDNPEASIRFHLLANQLGIDGDMASVVSSWAFECYEKGLLTKEETDGLELTWGNEEAMLTLMEKIAHREGLGDFLADGVKEASRKLGRGSERFAIHMKGQDSLDAYRIAKAWAFGLSTSPVGGKHLRGAALQPFGSGPKDVSWTPTGYENVPEVVLWQSQAEEIENMTGTCLFMGSFYGAHALEVSDYAELINTSMGMDLTEEELMRIARRSYNLEKAFNTIHAGFGRGDDFPPTRYMEEPISCGPYKGHKCDKEEWEKMLNRFYALHGWDKGTGLQTRKGLVELGLEDVADKLQEAGRLIE
jgi:aldehyde:ferredoxin oxidoreductase